jgi:hypothetical protein
MEQRGDTVPRLTLAEALEQGNVEHHLSRATSCAKCLKVSPENEKNLYCRGCQVVCYCCKQCADADWQVHKQVCKLNSEARQETLRALRDHPLSRKQFMTDSDNTLKWAWGVPGLRNEIELLAWEHRAKHPVFWMLINDTEISGNDISVTMFTREDWQESETFSDLFDGTRRQLLSGLFDSQGFDNQYAVSFTRRTALTGDFISPTTMIVDTFRPKEYAVAGTALVLELTSAPTLAVLRKAVTWTTTFQKPGVLEQVMERLNLPAPGLQASGNEIAFLILEVLQLSFEIRLVGLQNQSHLNGKVGTVLGFDTKNTLRMKVCVNGTDISVLSNRMVRAPLGFKRKMSKQ